MVPQVLLQVGELDEGPPTVGDVAFVGPLAWRGVDIRQMDNYRVMISKPTHIFSWPNTFFLK